MEVEISETQTSIIIVFFATLITSQIPAIVRKVRSKRRDNNVFKVSDSTATEKTCMRHRKKCKSSESQLLQLLNFFTGGLLFGLLVLRLMPLVYKQFDIVYNLDKFNNNSNNFGNTVVIEDNIIVLTTAQSVEEENKFKNLPYVELIISGFFFVVYFIEQIIQAFTGWDGWQPKSSFVQLPAISTTNQTKSRHSVNDKHLGHRPGLKEGTEPSLVACYRKRADDEIPEPSREDINDSNDSPKQTIQVSQQQHKPDCPLANQPDNDCNGTDTVNSRKLRIPSRPSQPSSIIIVLPTNDSNQVSTAWRQFKTGFRIISTVSVHQLTNGVIVALMEGYWCWLALVVIMCYSILTALMISLKLQKHCCDHYIVFLCQLIFSSIMPFGIIITSFLRISSFYDLLLMGLSNGSAFHLVFLTLVQSERCTRLAGLIQYLSMYTGFTLVLCVMLLIGNN